MPVVVANVVCEVIKEVALLASDAASVIVVRPWGDDEQASLSAGIKLAPRRFLQWGEAVFDEDYDGKSRLKSSSHDIFLARTDAR